MYSLFHLPTKDFEKVISDVFDILKYNGIFLLSYQIGLGEVMTDEPYLGDNGKGVLYMNYHSKEEVNQILRKYSFDTVFNFSKVEEIESAINSGQVETSYVIVKKVKNNNSGLLL